MPFDSIINADARSISKLINTPCVTTTITSPPYFDMKDYGVANQIGFGQTYEQYLSDIQNVFQQVYDITLPNGSLWIVIDTFKQNNRVVALPFDVVRKLEEIGWNLQDIIIWKKDRTVPWSSKGFVQRKFEYILFFSKTSEFKYYQNRVRNCNLKEMKQWWVKYPERYSPYGKAIDEVWNFSIPVQGSWGKKYIRHFCPLPSAMIEQMINLSTDESDIVFDPFTGSGAVISQAAFMKRAYIGIELNPDFIHSAQLYLRDNIDEQKEKYEKSKKIEFNKDYFDTIINLRILKYAKILIAQLKKELNIPYLSIYCDRLNFSKLKYKHVIAEFRIISESTNTKKISSLLETIINKPPLSKFGIEPVIHVISNFDFSNVYYYHPNKPYHFVSKISDCNNISMEDYIFSPIKCEYIIPEI